MTAENTQASSTLQSAGGGPVPEIDDYSDVLPRAMRDIWPVVAKATANLNRSLVGGTALAMHLRHRESFDLDILSGEGFSGERLQRKLQKLCETSGFSFDERITDDGSMFATINGVEVDVVAHPASSNPSRFRQLADPFVVDKLPVASLPDLLAMKLNVIMHRPRLRDYIDIAAIDKSGPYTIEDGLRFHRQRYGITRTSRIPERILTLLESPGQLSTDRVFTELADETLRYLKERALAAAQSDQWYTGTHDPGYTKSLSSLPTRPALCRAWMPRAHAYCRLPRSHRGHHRS